MMVQTYQVTSSVFPMIHTAPAAGVKRGGVYTSNGAAITILASAANRARANTASFVNMAISCLERQVQKGEVRVRERRLKNCRAEQELETKESIVEDKGESH